MGVMAAEVTWTASSAGYANGAEVSNVTVNANISLTLDKGTNSNAPKYYTSGTAVRCYGGNTIAVNATNATITGITFTFGSSDGSNEITANVGTFTSPSWSGSASAVTFTIGGTSGNRRISGIEVTYTTTGGSTDPETPTKQTPTITMDPISLTVGETMDLTATTNPEGLTVSYAVKEGSESYVSIASNVLTANAIGSATIIASTAETEAYNAASKEVAVTINAARPAGEFFYESFDTNDGTGGNDGSWSGSIASNTFKSDNQGWTVEKGNGANKCAKFGTGSALGTATTPALGQACNATLTFKAAAWNGNSESTTLKLSVVGGGSVSPATVTLTKGAWNTFTATLTGLTANSKIKFEGNATSNSRFFLDEVSVIKTGEVATLSSVAVSGTPTKTSYEAGENFDPAGLTVTGTYDDNSTETFTEGITWSTPAALAAGQTSVNITATVKGVTSPSYTVNGLTVTVPKTLSSIAVTGTPADLWKGDAFSHEGITVTATYSDETTGDVTADAEYTGYNMTTAGTQTVTVTYGEKTTTYTINVKTIANTQETAYTVAEAIALIDAGKDLATEVYVKGIVSEIVTEWSEQYNNITYAISADGTTDGNQFQLYRCKTNGAIVGNTVIAKGTLYKHTDGTYELKTGNTIVDIVAPAKTIDFVAAGTDAYYVTFSNDKAVTIPDMIEVGDEYAQLTVYSVYAVENLLELQEVTNNHYEDDGVWYLSENEGYLIKAEYSGDVTFTGSAVISVPYTELDYNLNGQNSENALRPASEEKDNVGKYYMLAYSDNTCKPASLGFYWGAPNGVAFTSRANSAYLKIYTAADSAPAHFLIEDEVTAVENIDATNVVKFIEEGNLYIQKNGRVYNAMGQLVK